MMNEITSHVAFADQAICIGDSSSQNSYLKITNIISAAEVADVEAIHPGYGFLAEDPHFAEICESCNLKFIGPPPPALELLGNKQKTRQVAQKLGIPVIPGSNQVLENQDEAIKAAHEIGYPVMIKAVAGGGGRGMRRAHNDVSLVSSFLNARAEAEAAFGHPGLYLEKLLERPRHIEIQILADEKGKVVHLGERDCTIQRKNQKLAEECPSPVVKSSLRNTLGSLAAKLVREANYEGVGTVEFLIDQNGEFYFLEMNCRIQVEHPVTEVVTGIDLVKAQIKLAAGENLTLRQKDIHFRGHALECRINAEDPFNDFVPSPGQIRTFHLPGGPGVRIDTHIYAGYTISPHYDSLIAKLITFWENRATAIKIMERALAEFKIEGVKTTIPLHQRIVHHLAFIRGDYGTNFLDENLGISVV